MHLKKNPDKDECQEVLTRQKNQADLEKMYTTKMFEGQKSYSRMVSVVYVILIYSSGMPILYYVGLIFCTITYFV